MTLPFSGTDSLVPGALKPLLDMGCGRNSVNRATQSPAQVHSFCGELDAGVVMDRGERDEISRGHQQWSQYMPSTTAGGLSCSRLRVKYSL